ncbi:hypothetical protein RJ639_002041 [Escallonia herrerae]|uniref:Peptidase M20 dimerisation domain-containing protein n=1 Tax=Escallonia herrerae TaxID=1293975 RepID=A0AA88XB71_9ASTE|nr:hypothetical protein RJ639_002041 [Escallonia herrerae]
MAAFRYSLPLLLSLLCILPFTEILVNSYEEDPTAKTMEDFSGYPIHEPPLPSNSLSVNKESLQKQIDELSTFSDSPAPSVTRILYTEKDVMARRTIRQGNTSSEKFPVSVRSKTLNEPKLRRFVKNLMGLSGLSVREDAVGNIFGRWEGYEPELAAVLSGSHIDAIPHSGKYDGVVGVLGAIEAINVLKRFGFKPKKSLEVIMFTSEEPTRFGISCLGSRLLAGSEALVKALKHTVDNHNISFLDAARSAGYAKDQEDLTSVFLDEDSYSAFVELHIEQGPILEEESISIGIVTAIAAPASIKVEFKGNGGHAGAVLMPNRNDAGLAAAELALAVEKHVLEFGSIDTVGTVGIMELHPGAINSIPSKAHLQIDTRDIDESRRNIVIDKIRQSASTISKNRGVQLSEFQIVNQDPPALSEDSVIKAMESASKELNLTHKKMISRAYHDSLFMARKSPMGMIFIPCYKGYSHKPEEYSSIEDIANGVRVLALTLAKLSLS